MAQSYDAEETAARRLYTLSLLISLGIVLGGIAWTWQIGLQANKVAHGLGHLQDDLKGMRLYLQKQEARKP